MGITIHFPNEILISQTKRGRKVCDQIGCGFMVELRRWQSIGWIKMSW